jgi:predicted aconitase
MKSQEEPVQLTGAEIQMLEGKHGYPVQKSMEILVGLGECFDAGRMIPVSSTHHVYSLGGVGKGGALFIREMAEKGGMFTIFSDTNPSNMDPSWLDLGISGDAVREQAFLIEAFTKMGAFLSDTCAPYLVGHSPRFREHVAWNESSAIIFANSVLGARTNREGGPSALAAALTGRVPEYGYHLDQNRRGDLRVLVTARLRGSSDYGTLGYFIGKVAEDRVPVLTGIPPSVSCDELKLLGAAAATSGSVALFHVVGVTPEAPTEDIAFGPRMKRNRQTIEFGARELRETEELLSTATGREIDLVILGCPHTSIGEFREIARLLCGKRLKPGVELWIFTSRMVRTYAEAMGYIRDIKGSGARVICNSCPVSMSQDSLRGLRHSVTATNSPKLAYYFIQGKDVSIQYGSMERCIEAAIGGRWGRR